MSYWATKLRTIKRDREGQGEKETHGGKGNGKKPALTVLRRAACPAEQTQL